MCGIFGLFVTAGNSNDSYVLEQLNRANLALRSRGPDRSGYWLSANRRFGLSHTLLSITDAPHNGAQPLLSEDERYVLVFNGEIYNHRELRKATSAKRERHWRTNSDTESLLWALITLGVDSTLELSVGMFAFAFFDLYTKKLVLCRDRFGEKPLYLGVSSKGFFFTSSLHARPSGEIFSNRLSAEGLALYQNYGFIPAPYSIYQDVIKVRPGHLVVIDTDEVRCPRSIGHIEQQAWWTLGDTISDAFENSIPQAGAEAAIEGELRRSIAGQVKNRVDTAVLLSGGIDSSLVAAIGSQVSDSQLRTFTVGFDNDNYDESSTAAVTAKILKTRHETVRVSSKSLAGALNDIGEVYDEPFSDSSQIPSVLVSKAIANSGIKVAITGDGGDELFGGYNRHKYTPLLNKMPKSLAQGLWPAGRVIFSGWEGMTSRFRRDSRPFVHDKLRKISTIFSSIGNDLDQYCGLLQRSTSIFNGTEGPIAFPSLLPEIPSVLKSNTRQRFMFLDATFYLPDDLLVKMDRASMAQGLETRAPFLDHKLAKCVWRVNAADPSSPISGKRIARKILKKYLPDDMPPTAKSGFSIPLGDYLKTSLKTWMEDRLNTSHPDCVELVKLDELRRLWKVHQDAKVDMSNSLWHAAMLINWIETR